MSKFLFFDIDGTLVEFGGRMPESTILALEKVRERGHKCFVCTGRCKSMIYPSLTNGLFDGYIAGTGAYVEIDGKVIYHNTMGGELVQQIVDVMVESGAAFILQRKEENVVTTEGWNRIRKAFPETQNTEGKPGLLERSLRFDDDTAAYGSRYPLSEALTYNESHLLVNELQSILPEGLTVTSSSYHTPRPYDGEITLSGVNKASGISKVLEYYGASADDAIGFGDAANDLEMLKFTGISVAMGNAQQAVKDCADLITKRIDEDGIYFACQQLGLFD